MRTLAATFAFTLVAAHASLASAGGTIRSLAQKGARTQTTVADLAPVVAPPVVVAQVVAPPIDGALDVTAEEPGTLLIDDAEYGTVPQKVEHLPPGPHRVTVRFDAGGQATRTIAVRLGVVTPVQLRVTGTYRAFRAREGLRFGLGAEGVYSVDPDGHEVRGGGRAFARLTYAPVPAMTLRGDLAVGALSGPYFPTLFLGRFDCLGYQRCPLDGAGDATTIPLLLRFDAQFNLGSVFSMSVGADVGMTVMSVRGPATFSSYNDHGYGSTSQEGSQSLSIVVPTVGIHASLLTFNFGPRRELTLALQQGYLRYLASGDGVGTFEQTASFSYRF